MSQKTRIEIKDVPEDWRGIEEIRRKLSLSMEIFSELLGVSYQTYHDRITGRQEGRYPVAFQALAEKIQKAYYQGLSINAIREFALEHVAKTLKGEVDENRGSNGEIRSVPGNLSGTGDESSLPEATADSSKSDRGEGDGGADD